MKKLLTLATAIAAMSSVPAYAATTSAPVSVRSVLCSASNTCTAYFAASQVADGTSCSRKSGDAVRWDASTQVGANLLSVLLAAQLSNRKVIITDEGCDGGGYPRLQWVQLF